jgi:hypothetical protein
LASAIWEKRKKRGGNEEEKGRKIKGTYRGKLKFRGKINAKRAEIRAIRIRM